MISKYGKSKCIGKRKRAHTQGIWRSKRDKLMIEGERAHPEGGEVW